MDPVTTCGTCAHWHIDPIDPNNITAPRQGECRYGPPVPVGVPTPAGLQVIVLYPKVPPTFAACGRRQSTAPTTTTLKG
jgi:hypothetical protein